MADNEAISKPDSPNETDALLAKIASLRERLAALEGKLQGVPNWFNRIERIDSDISQVKAAQLKRGALWFAITAGILVLCGFTIYDMPKRVLEPAREAATDAAREVAKDQAQDFVKTEIENIVTAEILEQLDDSRQKAVLAAKIAVDRAEKARTLLAALPAIQTDAADPPTITVTGNLDIVGGQLKIKNGTAYTEVFAHPNASPSAYQAGLRAGMDGEYPNVQIGRFANQGIMTLADETGVRNTTRSSP